MALLPRPFSRWTTYKDHGGIDYPQNMNTPIRASMGGRIDRSGWYSSRGGYAKFITYDNGVRCGYYHLVNLAGPGLGARVEYGQTFAYVGSTGVSTGPHLHHEVWMNGRIIRPPEYWKYMDQARYVGDGSGAGGGTVPLPLPIPKVETGDQDMRVIKRVIPAGTEYALVGTRFFQSTWSIPQANTWAEVWGDAVNVTQAAWDEALAMAIL